VKVLVFDAHPDVRPLVDGRAHSGSAFRQLLEGTPALLGRRLAYVGLQPFAIARSHREFLEQHGALLCFLPELQPGRLLEQVQELFERISEGGRLPVYVSLDLDALPAAVAPGVSAPSPIGVPAQELLQSLEWLGAQPAVRLLDLAEYAPPYDLDGRTGRMAALCVCALLAGRASRQRSTH
jgi:formiminoglutamase